MKLSVFLAYFLLCSASIASETFTVSYKLINQSGKNANIALSLGYDAQSTSMFCTHRSEDGRKFPKSIQRLVVLNNAQSHNEIETGFGLCDYKLNDASVVIIRPEVVKNILARDGKEVGPGIYEFKGAIGTNPVQVKNGQNQNILKCKFENGRLAATCKEREAHIQEQVLKLDIYVE